MFETVQATAPDPILALMMAFREDRRTDKIDLGVGVYKDAAGKTPKLTLAPPAIWSFATLLKT